jgi:hypothetical protein
MRGWDVTHSEDHADDLRGTVPPYRVVVVTDEQGGVGGALRSFDDAHDEQLAMLGDAASRGLEVTIAVADSEGTVVMESRVGAWMPWETN